MTRLSDTVKRHFLEPGHTAPLAHPTGEGWSGDVAANRWMRIQVQVEAGTVVASSFGTTGCAPCIAAGSLLCDRVTGRPVAEALSLTPEWLEQALGGLPPRRKYCAGLAVEALRAACQPGKGSD